MLFHTTSLQENTFVLQWQTTQPCFVKKYLKKLFWLMKLMPCCCYPTVAELDTFLHSCSYVTHGVG